MHRLIPLFEASAFRFSTKLSLSALLILLFPFGASAEETLTEGADNSEASSKQAIEEIVVTARKREEALQGLAGSAAALSEGFIEDIGGIEDLRQLTDRLVGMTITEGQLPEVSEPSIRGAGQARNRMSVSASGVYRNGAYIAGKGLFGRNFSRMDSYDLRQVEVYRGPQGALYGRNALGGAIHLISQEPVDRFESIFGVTAGENDMFGYEAIVNLPITDTLATRLSYVGENVDDGFYSDINGDPVDTSEYEHVRGSIKFEPEKWRVLYMYDYMDNEDTPLIGINPREPVRALNDYDDFQTLINTTHRNYHRVHNHNLQVSYDFSAGTLHLTSNYRDREGGWTRDIDHDDNTVFLATREVSNLNHTTEEMVFQEIRFDSAGADNLLWSIGADYYSADTTEEVDQYNPALEANTLARFDDPTGTTYESSMAIDQDSWSAFGMLEYRFDTMPLTLSGELRYARDEVDGTVEIYQPYQGCARTLGLPPCTYVDDDRSYENLPWTVTAKWRFENLPEVLSNAMVYGRIGSSYRNGGLNLSAGLPSNAYAVKPIYNEETAIVYEVGVKSAWFEDRVLLNASLYSTDYEDFLNTTTNGCPDLCPYLDPEDFQPLGYNPDGSRIEENEDGEPGQPSGTAYFIDNIGEVSMWGYEIELSAFTAVGRGSLNTFLGYSRQLGEVDSIRDDVSPANLELEGVRLNHMRPHNWSAAARFRYPLASAGVLANINFITTLTWVREEGGYQTLPEVGIPARKLDDFSRFDARIGLDSERWSLILQGSNITDEEYILDETAAGVVRINDPSYYSLQFYLRF